MSEHADAIRILRCLTDEQSRPITLHIGYSKHLAAAADALERLATAQEEARRLRGALERIRVASDGRWNEEIMEGVTARADGRLCDALKREDRKRGEAELAKAVAQARTDARREIREVIEVLPTYTPEGYNYIDRDNVLALLGDA
jgi:hypothetical protein